MKIDKVYCHECGVWVDISTTVERRTEITDWLCCSHCGEGLMMSVNDIKISKQTRKAIAKGIWELK